MLRLLALSSKHLEMQLKPLLIVMKLINKNKKRAKEKSTRKKLTLKNTKNIYAKVEGEQPSIPLLDCVYQNYL